MQKLEQYCEAHDWIMSTEHGALCVRKKSGPNRGEQLSHKFEVGMDTNELIREMILVDGLQDSEEIQMMFPFMSSQKQT